jgi:hypothetical protein
MVLNMEDFVANALIESIEERDERKISFKQLDLYRNNVRNMLKEHGKAAIIPVSETNTKYCFYNYSDFFEWKNDGEENYILLKEGKNIDDLRKSFRAYLPLDVLLIFSRNKLLEPEQAEK